MKVLPAYALTFAVLATAIAGGFYYSRYTSFMDACTNGKKSQITRCEVYWRGYRK